IPYGYIARAIAAGRDRSLEVDVAERVILDVDRLSIVLGILGNPVGYRPRRERPLMLEAQVPVQSLRMVLVYHEASTGNLGEASLLGLRGGFEVTLAPILLESRRLHSLIQAHSGRLPSV